MQNNRHNFIVIYKGSVNNLGNKLLTAARLDEIEKAGARIVAWKQERLGRREIAAALTRAGFTTTVRYSLGSDIAAACGQLARTEMHNLLDSRQGMSGCQPGNA